MNGNNFRFVVGRQSTKIKGLAVGAYSRVLDYANDEVAKGMVYAGKGHNIALDELMKPVRLCLPPDKIPKKGSIDL